jgi:hypothetical protein
MGRQRGLPRQRRRIFLSGQSVVWMELTAGHDLILWERFPHKHTTHDGSTERRQAKDGREFGNGEVPQSQKGHNKT